MRGERERLTRRQRAAAAAAADIQSPTQLPSTGWFSSIDVSSGGRQVCFIGLRCLLSDSQPGAIKCALTDHRPAIPRPRGARPDASGPSAPGVNPVQSAHQFRTPSTSLRCDPRRPARQQAAADQSRRTAAAKSAARTRDSGHRGTA